MSQPTQSPRADEALDTDERTEEERLAAAQLYVQQLRAFYIHAAMFAIGMAIIFVVNLATNLADGVAGELRAWWSLWALLGWGLGIAVHGLVVRLNRPAGSSPSWEQLQIDKVLER